LEISNQKEVERPEEKIRNRVLAASLAIQHNKYMSPDLVDNFRYRTRYFTDSGVIGSKKFVKKNYQRFKDSFDTKKEKKPVPIKGLSDIYSLKRLASGIL
jgi:hypothetical protein